MYLMVSIECAEQVRTMSMFRVGSYVRLPIIKCPESHETTKVGSTRWALCGTDIQRDDRN